MSNYKEFKLTKYTKDGGWGSKFSLEDLGEILSLFNLENKNPNILVDASTKDDAAVYRINENACIVVTVDFFPPNVDDPFTYGQIAASNSMSDIYAMGGDPLIGLNIAAFPKSFPKEIINKILSGAIEKCNEAGLSIVGGHTIYDEEPKYGLAVIGTINCNSIRKNNTAQEGDLLILTKPLGTGIITQSIKNNYINAENAINESIKSMTMLNKKASEIIKNYPVNACVDITGFGLLGHLYNMISQSNKNCDLKINNIPLFKNLGTIVDTKNLTSGTTGNIKYLNKKLIDLKTIDEKIKTIICDAQTSGGLLISIPAEFGDEIIIKLNETGHKKASIIGQVTKKKESENKMINFINN